MLLRAVIGALALLVATGCVVGDHPGHDDHNRDHLEGDHDDYGPASYKADEWGGGHDDHHGGGGHGGQAHGHHNRRSEARHIAIRSSETFRRNLFASHFDTYSSHFQSQIGVFQSACKEKDIAQIHSGFSQYQSSFAQLASDCGSGLTVDIATEISTKYIDLLAKLQASLKVVHQNDLVSQCQPWISQLSTPINTVISFIAKAGIDFRSKCTSGNAVDLDFFAQVGVKFNFPSVTVGHTAGVTASSDDSKWSSHSDAILSRFESTTVNFQNQASVFEVASKSQNIAQIHLGLDSIQTSLSQLVSVCGSGFTRAVATEVSAKYIALLVKLQIVLKSIHQHNLVSQCQSFITPLISPVNVLISLIIKSGVDFHSQCAASSNAIDLNFFAQVGLHLNFNVNIGVGLSARSLGGDHSYISHGTSQANSILSHFQSVTGHFDNQYHSFEDASKTRNIAQIHSGLDSIRSSLVELVTGCGNGLDLSLATDVSTKYIALLVKLQIVIKTIHQYNLLSECQSFISTLRSPINTLVAFVVKAGVDFHSQCASSRNAIDLNFFAQVGLQLDFNVHVDANVGVGIGAGHGHGSGSVVSAGAHVGIGAGTSQGQSILSRFQSLSNNFQGQIPAFETASKSKNINEIKSGLDQIHSSFTELGNECGSGLHADLAADVSTHYISLLVKLQVVLKSIQQHNLVSQCQPSILQLRTSVNLLIGVIVKAGVDFRSKCEAESGIDLKLFAQVGLNLDLDVGVGVGVSVNL